MCACDLWGRFADLYLELLSGVRGSAACNFSLSDSILTAIGACDCCLRSGPTSAIRGHSLSLGQTIFTVSQGRLVQAVVPCASQLHWQFSG